MSKPNLQQIPLAIARDASPADYLIQRKSDGAHCFVSLPGFEPRFNAERMSGAHGGVTRINDVLLDGADTAERVSELVRMARHFPPGFELELALSISTINSQPSTAAFLAAEIACGGEGVVLKPWKQAFGIGWLKAKRCENFIVRVTDAGGGRNSVEVEILASALGGQKSEDGSQKSARPPTADFRPLSSVRTRVPLFGGKSDLVRDGSILKVVGFGLTAKGCIREPRPDTDTETSWLVKY